MKRLLAVLFAVTLLLGPRVASAADTIIYYNSSYITTTQLAGLKAALTTSGASVTTSSSSTWPTSYSGYKLVIFLLPSTSFSTTQASALKSFVNAGGRVVVAGDWQGQSCLYGICWDTGFYAENDNVNTLLTRMGSTVQLDATAVAGSGCSVKYSSTTTSTSVLVYGDQVTYGESDLYIAAGTTITNGTSLGKYAGSKVLVASQLSSTTSSRSPYDVVVSGDVDAFLDTCTASSGSTANEKMWENLYPWDLCDADSDGWFGSAYKCGGSDCDDTSASISPGATETCNGVDDDCDGTVDDGVKKTYYADSDGDGYGDSTKTSSACSAPSGYVTDKTDCDDTRKTVHPGATETCNSLDDDCDGSIDEGVTSTFYYDADGDGYGNASVTTTGCSAPSGYTSDKTDCNDGAATVHPGATETCNGVDDDCDGSVDEGVTSAYYRDADGDGFGTSSSSTSACSAPTGYVSDQTDCDDAKASVHPGASEYCNSVDDDCDGSVDESAVDASTWYADADGDGYGDAASSVTSCSAPSAHVADATDCDDAAPSIHPGATEVAYDGVDQDCSGADLVDVDGDGYAWDGIPGGDDCDDDDATVHPTATETADGVDQDCDGDVDEGTDWVDDDGDGFAEAGGDCDDGDASVNPAATETCDSVDQDCDGVADDGTTCHDDDGDGYTEYDGDCNDSDAAISPAATEDLTNGKDDDCDGVVDTGAFDDDGDGYTEPGGDCAEGDAAVHPGAVETANGVDDDCDGLVDEGTAAYDDDGDGYTELDGDCDDHSAATHPGAIEVTDGVDDDCDGVVDEGSDRTDDDGDGVTEEGGDCDDTDADVYPGAFDGPDGKDNDCDGMVDDATDDADGDGFSVADGDCDDHDGWKSPAEDEVCDGLDNDCDGQTDDGCAEEQPVTTDKAGGCGCDSEGGAPSAVGLLLLAVVARRRRSKG